MLVERWAAFTSDPRGGNPAGVVLDAIGVDASAMQRVAADVGYSETAFLTGQDADGAVRLRYFTPMAEIDFCGHATLATALALAPHGRAGSTTFRTAAGDVAIDTVQDDHGLLARFTSVEPRTRPLTDSMVDDLHRLLGFETAHLALPALEAYAGNWHPILVVRDLATFDAFRFDPGQARAVLDRHGWQATITVLYRDDAEHWQARNIFPVGAITEDPATGAAAAATGGYLRALGETPASGHLVIEQGRHVGRPSRLDVHIPTSGGIVVSGRGVPITG